MPDFFRMLSLQGVMDFDIEEGYLDISTGVIVIA